MKNKSKPNISRIGGSVKSICLINLLTPPKHLVSTKKIGLRARVTRKCDDCRTNTVIASKNMMTNVIHCKNDVNI